MPDLRPVVSIEQARTLLQEHFHAPILHLAPLEGGQVACTFAFRVAVQEYVLRFNLDKMLNSNFPKATYITRPGEFVAYFTSLKKVQMIK